MKANEMQRIPPFLSSTTSSFHSPSTTPAPNGSKTFPSLSSCHFLWMRHEQRTGVRVRTSFECQNWPREKGALPRGAVVKGRRKRMERQREKNPPPLSLPSLLKKEVDLGQLWSRERESAALRPNNGGTSTPLSPSPSASLVCDIATTTNLGQIPYSQLGF